MSHPRTLDPMQAPPSQPIAAGRTLDRDVSPATSTDPIRDVVVPKSSPRRPSPAHSQAVVGKPFVAKGLKVAAAPVATMPAGIVLLSSMQFLMAGLVVVVVLLLSPVRLGVAGGMAARLMTAWPALLMLAAGTGMLLRWTWGWRLTTTIAWFLLGNPVCEFVLGLMRGQLAVSGLGFGVFALAFGVVAYLNSAKQMAVFGIGDPESAGRNRPLPAMAGLSAAAIGTLAAALA